MKHIVFFKLSERTKENQDKLVTILNKMQGKIDFVHSLSAKADFLNSERSFDVVLEVTLDKENLDAYANDPLHVACKQEFASFIEKTVVVDVE